MKKKLIIILFFCFIGISNIKAEIETYDRNTLNNYGVNKKWDINNKNKENVLNTYAVNANDKIYDFADILTENEEKILYNMSVNFYNDTGMELILLTDNFYNTTDEENEEFAVDFYDYNDFGLEDEYYSGVIIFRNSYESYPYYAIYTFGNAQFYYSNSRLDYILDYMYSDMTNHNYLKGFNFAIEELNTYYEMGTDSELDSYYLDDMGFLKQKYQPPIIFAFVISGIITAIVISILVGKNKMIYKSRFAHDYLDKNSIAFTLQKDQFITSKTTSYTISSSSGGSSGGGSRSGSSGGGHGGGGRRG